MFKRINEEADNFRTAIDVLFTEMEEHSGTSEEYDRLTDQVAKLSKIRHENDGASKVSADTLIIAGANILGILIIVGHEQTSVITSKAINFIMKPR